MFSNDKLATKGDVNRDVARHVGQVQNQINDMYSNMATHLNSLQQETSNKMNLLAQNLESQNQRFEELQQKLNNPLANQANELRNRAIESFNNRWLKEAKEEINKALELNSKDFVSYLILARIYKKEGDLNKAIEYYNLAIKYSKPYDQEFWKDAGIEKALTYVEIARNFLDSDLDKAIEYFDLALDTVREFSFDIFQEIGIEKALAYYKYGFIDNALDTLNKLGERNLLVNVYYYKAWVLIDLNRLDEAFQNAVIYISNTLDTATILDNDHFSPIKEKIEEWIQKEIDPILEKEKNEKTKIKEDSAIKLVECLKKIEKTEKEYQKSNNKVIMSFKQYKERNFNLSDKYKKLFNIKANSLNSLKDFIENLKKFQQEVENLNQDVNNFIEKLNKEKKRKIIQISIIVSIIIGILTYLIYSGILAEFFNWLIHIIAYIIGGIIFIGILLEHFLL